MIATHSLLFALHAGCGHLIRAALAGARDVTRRIAAAFQLPIACLGIVIVACGGGCGHGAAGRKVVAVPEHAITVAPYDGGKALAVLAGTEDAKGIFEVSIGDGRVLNSFSVSNAVTAVSAAGADGPFLLSIANRGSERSIGAVEEWSVAGRQVRTVPMPAAAIDVTPPVDGTAFVLIENGSARAAVPLRLADASVGRPIPLPANIHSLSVCRFGQDDYLVMSDSVENRASVLDVRRARVLSTDVVADNPECLAQNHAIYGIARAPGGAKTLVAIRIPSLLQAGLFAISNESVKLSSDQEGDLVVLHSAENRSSVEILPSATLALSGS